MKKIFAASLTLFLIVGPSLILCADQGAATTTEQEISDYRMEVGSKAERGVKNALFGWTEIPKRIVDITQETKNPIWGLLAGGFQGTLKAMSRTASGVCDVVTAPINPEKGPLMQPDINVE